MAERGPPCGELTSEAPEAAPTPIGNDRQSAITIREAPGQRPGRERVSSQRWRCGKVGCYLPSGGAKSLLNSSFLGWSGRPGSSSDMTVNRPPRCGLSGTFEQSPLGNSSSVLQLLRGGSGRHEPRFNGRLQGRCLRKKNFDMASVVQTPDFPISPSCASYGAARC